MFYEPQSPTDSEKVVLLVRASTRGGVSLTNAAIPILSNYCKHGVEGDYREEEKGQNMSGKLKWK